MRRASISAPMCAVTAAVAALCSATPCLSQTAEETAKAQAEIWSNEQAVYSGRADGELNTYAQATHPQYLAWPPFAPAPFRLDGLKQTSHRVAGKGEVLTMAFKDFTMSGDTAIIYYQTHRTAMGDGAPVDQTYENIHVWKKDGGVWKVLGGMARERPSRK